MRESDLYNSLEILQFEKDDNHNFIIYNFSEYTDSDEWDFEIPSIKERIHELREKFLELSSF